MSSLDSQETTKHAGPDPERRITPAEYALMAGRFNASFRKNGMLNAYVCQKCKAIRITIDRDHGKAPAFLICDKCPTFKMIGKIRFNQPPAIMQSSFYSLPDGVTEAMATFEFYRPSYGFYLAITHFGTRKHVETGGLLLRRIGEALPEGFGNPRKD